MKLRGVIGVGAGAIAIVVWTACVGDDPAATTTAVQGAQNQPCFANGTCLVGLTCASGVCLIASGSDAGSGGTSTSSSSSSSSGAVGTSGDAATPADGSVSTSSSGDGGPSSASSSSSSGTLGTGGEINCSQVGDAMYPLCPTPSGDQRCNLQAPTCCPGLGCAPVNTSCAAPARPITCFSDGNCSNNQHCCVSANAPGKAPSGVSCVDDVIAMSGAPACASACANSELHLCAQGADDSTRSQSTCASGEVCTIVGIEVTDADGIIYVKDVGYCVAQDAGVSGGL